ncbi:inosose dehydratase, partial [Clostridium botulinum C str. Stockholm]
MAVLKKYVNRIKHVHLKDVRPEVVEKLNQKIKFLQAVNAGAFTVPGDGCIDFEPLFKVLAENNYEGYLLVEAEQDPAKANPLEYAIKARKYIKEKAGL